MAGRVPALFVIPSRLHRAREISSVVVLSTSIHSQEAGSGAAMISLMMRSPISKMRMVGRVNVRFGFLPDNQLQ